MKHKRNLKENTIYVVDDLTPLRAKTSSDLRSKADIRAVRAAKEKNIELMHDNQKPVLENFYRLQKWQDDVFPKACNGVKRYSLWNFGMSDIIWTLDVSFSTLPY